MSGEVANDLEALERIEREAEAIDGEDLEQSQPEPEIPTSELIYPIISMAMGVMVPNWEISEEENKALAQSYGDLLDKYFPDVGANFGVELNALLITAAIITPRLGKPLKKAPPKEKGEAERAENVKETPKPENKGELSMLDVQETINGEPV